MTRPPDGWSASLRCDSRTGAAHLRRGAPCQDASGFWTLADASGDPVRLLVVSDGHGGSRYIRSDVGSQLACRVTFEVIGRSLAASRTGQPGQEAHWRRWLSETLPELLVAAWGKAIRQHWQTNPVPDDGPFSPVPYGATLGVLVLTPSWWGHTGLGDWDLVRIEASGEGHLVSEEPAAEAAGEATCSLCMQGAARQFAARSGLHQLGSGTPPFSLMLSTDGIRKSCGSDADFLTLARYLVDLPDPSGLGSPAELSSALDHISSQGSGDDVSVAIGRWQGVQHPSARASLTRRSQPRVVQPSPPVPPPSRPETSAAADRAVQPRQGAAAIRPMPAKPASVRRDADAAALRVWLGSVLAGLGVLLLLAWKQGWGPFAAGRDGPAVLTAAQRLQLQGQVAQMCAPAERGDDRRRNGSGPGAPRSPADDGASLPAANQPQIPEAPPAAAPGAGTALQATSGAAVPMVSPSARALQIRGTLNNRGSTFRRLLSGNRDQLQELLQASRTDPLGALIAWSRLEPSLAPGLAPLATGRSGNGAPQQAQVLRLCPELRRELQRQWLQRARLAAGPAGSMGVPAAEAPPVDRPGAGEGRRPAAARPVLAPESAGEQDAPGAIPQRQER